jgi:ectoine hydroxylase-related dioxygenase (phytanoyl-CoA dioxygenase family)
MEKYYANEDNILEKINKYGVAIIPNVLNKKEKDEMNEGMWNYLENLTSKFETPISRDDEKTWREFWKLYPKHSMLLQQWRIGHAQFIWDLRQNEKVFNKFAKIWDCKPEELLTSFDGASFHLPPEKTNRGWFNKSWYHCDQSFQRNDFECVQSWITANDVNKNDATLAFLEKSNRLHKKFKDYFKIETKEDWNKLTEEQINFYKKRGCKEKRIKCPGGSMVFWDSRTIHCGSEPIKNRDGENFRNVVYICMIPRNRATNNDLKKKKEAFNNLRTTTHWPAKIKLFPEKPRTYGGELPNVNLDATVLKPKLNDIGKKLAGF